MTAGAPASTRIDMLYLSEADVIAAGNVGCIAQLATGTNIPLVHPVELVDWATGGPIPAALAGRIA